jgi:hypothetical protein
MMTSPFMKFLARRESPSMWKREELLIKSWQAMKIVYMIGTRSKTINKPQERKAVQNNNRTNTGSTQKMAETTLTKHPSIKRVSNLVKMQGWESVLFSKHSAKTSSTMTIQKMQREYQILNSSKMDLQIE